MTTLVEKENEISLDGVRYRIKGNLESVLASVYAAKVVIGDTTRDSQPRSSVLAVSDQRGGIGMFKSEAASTVDRCWWSTCGLRHKSLTLPRLATATALGPATDIQILVEYNDIVYATYDSSVRSYDSPSDAWSAQLHLLPSSSLATDAVVARLDGVVYLFIAHNNGSAYGYSYFNGSSWANGDEDALYMAWWDHKIWAIDNTGQLRFSTFASGAPGSWSNDAQLPLPDGYVTGLFTGKDSNGNRALFAMTKVGLFVHDFINGEFVPSEFTLPRHKDNGRGTARWRDSMYIPAGNSVYRYTDGASTAVSVLVGPDKDDGLPSDKRGTIKKMVPSHNELFALLDGTTAPLTVDMYASGESTVIDPDIGFSSILGYNELGWEVTWLGTASKAITDAIVSNAYDKYRLWWAQNERVYFMDLPVDIVNPDQISDAQYAPSATHESPWFNMNQDEVTKLAMHLDEILSGITSTETVTLSYALDLIETYTEVKKFDDQPSDTHIGLPLPSAADQEGVPYYWFKYKLDLARGSDNTKTPQVHSTTLVYRKKLTPKNGFSFTIDLHDEHDGRSPSEMRESLARAVASEKKLLFTYRADDINSDVIREYYVDVVSASHLEATGRNERGTSRVSLVEP